MIRAKIVHTPGGTVWTVRRRWAPRPKWRSIVRLPRLSAEPLPVERPKARWYEFLDPLEIFGEFPLLLAAIALILLLIFVGIPLAVFLVETLLILPVALVTGVFARVFWRRPWDIEATGALTPERHIVWTVRGWRASDRAAARIVTAIRASGDVADETPADLVLPRERPRAVR